MLNRYSSRRQPLDAGFLNARLAGARTYDRIAGYFSSSVLEVAGEALDQVQGKTRVVCNSGLSPEDVEIAKAAQAAMRREWCESRPERLGDAAKPRFKRLYEWLRSVIQDLERLVRRELVDDVGRWREEPEAASVVVEAPVYRKEVGLWEHQKHFVKIAFDAHRGPHGARFVQVRSEAPVVDVGMD